MNTKNYNEILLNYQHSGRYVENNIGHEFINFCRDDLGRIYIYITSYGRIAKKHNDKVDCILLAKYRKGVVEILAKVSGLEQVTKIKKNLNEDKDLIKKGQKQFIRNNEIEYGGEILNKVFEGNNNSGYIFITYKATEYLRPKKRLFVTLNGNEISKENLDENNTEIVYLNFKDCSLKSQSMKIYFSENNHYDMYKEIKEKIIDNDIWEDQSSLKTLDEEVEGLIENKEKNILNKTETLFQKYHL